MTGKWYPKHGVPKSPEPSKWPRYTIESLSCFLLRRSPSYNETLVSNTPRHVHPRALLLNSQHTESTMQNVYNDVAQIRVPIKRRSCLVISIISSGVHNHSAIPCEDAHTHLSIEIYKYTVYICTLLLLTNRIYSRMKYLQTTR